MIYYYHCYRGAHLSIVAAALHLNKLSLEAGVSEILALDYFDKLQPQDMGTPVLAGYDQANNPVYFVGLGRGSKIFARFADSITGEINLDIQYKSVDCLPCLTFITRLGGFLSRYRRLRWIGRYLAARGVHANLRKINTLVLQARRD